MITPAPLPMMPELEGNLALDADQRAVMLRELKEQMFAFNVLVGMLTKNEEMPAQMARSVLYLAESRTAQLCKLTGIELETVQEREDRYARIRTLNEQVRALQAELGKTGTADQTAAYLKNLHTKLNKWWDREGFGHISEFHVNEYGMADVKFSCHLFGDFRLIDSDTPVSDKERKRLWHESLQERGFNLSFSPNERDPELIANDNNREGLRDLFATAFPTAEMVETSDHYNSRSKTMVLRDVRVLIRDLQEVMNLPDEV